MTFDVSFWSKENGNTRETAHALRGMPLIKAKRYLEDGLAHKQAIPFTRLCRGVGRTSWTSKESPFKWTRTSADMYAKFILDFSRMQISTLRLKGWMWMLFISLTSR
ncbi:60S ribosomal protein L17-2-like protein [Tanacetum coccineum]